MRTSISRCEYIYTHFEWQNIMIDEMVIELLGIEIPRDAKFVLSDEMIILIHKIAKECKNNLFTQKSLKSAEEYAAGLTAEDIYIDMLHKIVDAPTSLHMRMVPRVLIPLISEKLKVRGQ